MSSDISIDFEGKNPGFDELSVFVEAFFGGAAECEIRETNNYRWLLIKLPGKPSHFQYKIAKYPMDERLTPSDRWIEFWAFEESALVTTRMQDDYTNSLAQGLANFVQRAICLIELRKILP